MTDQWTPAELAAYIDRQYGDDPAQHTRARHLTRQWLARGDGAAIYENHDLGHHGLGACQIASYGSRDATLPVPEDDLPERLPDFPGRINWRYVLVATCRLGDAP